MSLTLITAEESAAAHWVKAGRPAVQVAVLDIDSQHSSKVTTKSLHDQVTGHGSWVTNSGTGKSQTHSDETLTLYFKHM